MNDKLKAHQRPVGPDRCPFTGRAFWGNIDHPELGEVATYGGPFDTYTLPARTDDDPDYRVHRFDHDHGHWLLDEVESIGMKLVNDQLYTIEENPAELRAENERLREQLTLALADCERTSAGEASITVGPSTIDKARAWLAIVQVAPMQISGVLAKEAHTIIATLASAPAPSILAAPLAGPQRADEGFSHGIAAAAAWVKQRADDYDQAFGATDPDTGTREYPGTGDEYMGELAEIEEGILALQRSPKNG